MHPPLDRPHPRCQDEINGLRECHATGNKLKFWACNEVKAKLDKCFREEKEEMLRKMNANLDEKKKEEHAQAALAFGKTETFQEYWQRERSRYVQPLRCCRKRRQYFCFGNSLVFETDETSVFHWLIFRFNCFPCREIEKELEKRKSWFSFF